MKKLLFSASLLTILLVGCNKAEIAAPEIQNEEPQMAELKAEIINTKTTYDVDGKFSWVTGDKITVVVQQSGKNYDLYTYSTSSDSGPYAVFTGSAINSPWEEVGVALYPNKNVVDKNAVKQVGAYGEPLKVSLNQEIVPDLNNPLGVIPLIGRKNANDIYQFKTATGIIKVTVTDIPADAYYLYLQDPSGTYAFSGTFEIDDRSEIRSSDLVPTNANDHKKTIAFTPQAAGETRTFYFPVPTGTIPAGITLKLDKGSAGGFDNIMTKTTNVPITITANHVTNLGTVAAETWTTLGTGKFLDDDGFYSTGGPVSHIDVTIQQNDTDDTRYRVVNPYQVYIDANSKSLIDGAKGPDPYFYFTLKDGYVEFNHYRTGLQYYSYGYEFGLDHPKARSYTNYWNNCVIKYAGDGITPLNVMLSPVEYNVSTNAVTVNCSQNPKIEIVFPTSSAMLTKANFANRGTATCSSSGEVTATLGTDVTAIKAVAAASLDAGVAALKAESAGMLTFTASESQSFTGLEEGTTYRFVYKVETDGHGFAFKDGGSFTTPASNQVALTSSMITVSANETYSGDDGGPAALVDGNTGTHWHSPWSFAGTYDSTYGIYIDIDLGSGNELTKFKLRFCLRNSLNDHPDHVKVYASTDGSTWGSSLGELSDIYSTYGKGNWTDFITCTAAAPSRYIRLSILQSTGSNANVSDLTKSGCTHMAELQLFNLD